jgi:hypothetical protein
MYSVNMKARDYAIGKYVSQRIFYNSRVLKFRFYILEKFNRFSIKCSTTSLDAERFRFVKRI